MRRRALLVIALLLSVTVAGLGLAWWTDQLSVAGTVSTGKAQMNFVDYRLETDDPYLTTSISAKPDQLSPNTLEVSIRGLYPSVRSDATNGKVWLTAVLKNTGTVPLRFTGVTLTTDPPESQLANYVVGKCYLVISPDGVQRSVVQLPYTGPLTQLDDAITSYFEDNNISIVLQPGGYIGFGDSNIKGLQVFLHEQAQNDLKNKFFNFTLKFDFVQWNAQ